MDNCEGAIQPQSKLREIGYGGEDIFGGDEEIHTPVHTLKIIFHIFLLSILVFQFQT